MIRRGSEAPGRPALQIRTADAERQMTLLVISVCTGAAVFIIGLTRSANHELWTTLPTARRHSNVILEHTHKKRVQPYPRDIYKVHIIMLGSKKRTHEIQ